jgi:hypothetical protein
LAPYFDDEILSGKSHERKSLRRHLRREVPLLEFGLVAMSQSDWETSQAFSLLNSVNSQRTCPIRYHIFTDAKTLPAFVDYFSVVHRSRPSGNLSFPSFFCCSSSPPFLLFVFSPSCSWFSSSRGGRGRIGGRGIRRASLCGLFANIFSALFSSLLSSLFSQTFLSK